MPRFAFCNTEPQYDMNIGSLLLKSFKYFLKSTVLSKKSFHGESRRWED